MDSIAGLRIADVQCARDQQSALDSSHSRTVARRREKSACGSFATTSGQRQLFCPSRCSRDAKASD